ncbi:MAG: hypothetical protein WCD49_08395 [Candidatus Acidiferrales bacterium]
MPARCRRYNGTEICRQDTGVTTARKSVAGAGGGESWTIGLKLDGQSWAVVVNIAAAAYDSAD